MRFLAGCFTFILLLSVATALPAQTQPRAEQGMAASLQRPDFPREIATIFGKNGGRRRLWLEVARTPEQLAYGLMGLRKLPETDGMLFLSSTPRQQMFWMKETYMPLDLLFIAADGKINFIHTGAKPLSEAFIVSQQPALGVLELPAGKVKSWRLQIGDRVSHPAFGPS
jgi:uncharacterized protein